MKKKAVLIVGHGSRVAHFQKPMEQLAGDLRKDRQYQAVACCYLEITAPSVTGAIRRFIEDGFTEIIVFPYFLLMGNHVKSDIPNLVKSARAESKGRARIKLCRYLGYDKQILAVVKRRLREVL